VLISGVLDGAPAAKAGLKPGDVLTRIGARKVLNPTELLAAVAALPPQSEAKVSVQRGAQQLEFTLKIVQRPKPQSD